MESSSPNDGKTEILENKHATINKNVEMYSKSYSHLDPAVVRAAVLTGMYPETVQKIKDDKPVPSHNQAIDRNVVHAELNNFILKLRKLPTTRELFLALYKKISHYEDMKSFRKKLVLMDFVWKKIPNYAYVVTERPEVTYEGYMYLKRVLESVGNGMPLCYVDEVVTLKNGALYTVYDEIDTKEGITERIIYGVTTQSVFVKKVEVFDENTFKDFLLTTLMPQLSVPTLVIYNNAKHHQEEYVKSNPTIYSLKRELMEWLDYNNVPYHSSMPKSELLTLVQKCTNCTGDTFKCDELLRCNGHAVLRLPDHLRNLSPTTFVFDKMKLQSGTGSVLWYLSDQNEVSTWHLPAIFEYVVEKMRKRLDIENEIDAVLDELVENMSSRTCEFEEDSDVPVDDISYL